MISIKSVVLAYKKNKMIQHAVALHQSGRLAEARQQYQKLLGILPDNAICLTNLGTIALQEGNAEDAVKMIGRSLQIAADQPDALNNLGNALRSLKRWDEALTSYDRAISLRPGFASACFNRGNTLLDLKRQHDALTSYECAITISPRFAEAWIGCGNALRDLKRFDEALTRYGRAIALRPDFAEAWISRGNALRDLKRRDEALASYDQAIALSPNSADAWSCRGNALQDLKRLDEALASYERAITLNPNFAGAWSNRGNALQDLTCWDEALISYERAISINPDYAEAWCNQGNVFRDLKCWDEAFASYERATLLDPSLAEAWWNNSLTKLITGEYQQGWQWYEWRWKKPPLIFSQKIYPQPLWLGEQSLTNKTLLIYPEQGFGDYIQFIRYASLAEQRGASVILEVPPAMMAMTSTLKGQFTLIEAGQPLPDFDYHCPVMSLPLAFNTRLETIPCQIPYLFSDKTKQAAWQQRLGEKSVPRIGLVCSASFRPKNDHFRSITLKQFEPLFELPVELHCLQKELRSADLQFLINSSRIKDHRALLHDFSDTAALIEQMDLVISVDTSVAHLAGALGKKVWILLSDIAAERWLLDREDSPWYSTATLFRQPVLDDWDSVIINVRNRLKQQIAVTPTAL